jgi:hypothetical protein
LIISHFATDTDRCYRFGTPPSAGSTGSVGGTDNATSTLTGKTQTTDAPAAKKQCTEAVKEQPRAPKFNKGDIVIEKVPLTVTNAGSTVKVPFKINDCWWSRRSKMYYCAADLPLASGGMVRIDLGENNLVKVELTPGKRYVVEGGDGVANEATLDRYYFEGNTIKCEVSYKETVDYTDLKPVSEDSAGATGAA